MYLSRDEWLEAYEKKRRNAHHGGLNRKRERVN